MRPHEIGRALDLGDAVLDVAVPVLAVCALAIVAAVVPIAADKAAHDAATPPLEYRCGCSE